MKAFAELFTAIDQSTKTTVKTAALAEYFRTAPESDRLWTVALFSGRRPKRAVTTTQLREWAAERAGVPLWLLEECYPIVGDLAETIALLLPPPGRGGDRTLTAMLEALSDLPNRDLEARKAFILEAWDGLDETERFLFNKLITGGFRIGVSRKLMTRALAQATGQDEPAMALRLMGDWTPQGTTWDRLVAADTPEADDSRPYPFYLAYQIDAGPDRK
ncbi:ATP-dependent DNA ligase, partial [Salipiger sp. HF18]|nr:ATP-dependent DNA ligase [Salipiger sp. HF18]